jgi:hypothetical protein
MAKAGRFITFGIVRRNRLNIMGSLDQCRSKSLKHIPTVSVKKECVETIQSTIPLLQVLDMLPKGIRLSFSFFSLMAEPAKLQLKLKEEL